MPPRRYRLLRSKCPWRGLLLPASVALFVLPLLVGAARSRPPCADDAREEASELTSLSVAPTTSLNPAWPSESSLPDDPPPSRNLDASPEPWFETADARSFCFAVSQPTSGGAAARPDAFDALPAVTFYQRSRKRSARYRLYLTGGVVDPRVARELDEFLADVRDPKQPRIGHIDRRLLRLVFRAAYHFEAKQIDVLSAYREQIRRREGLHAHGRALDFSIPGVKLELLASYLRTAARVGVGIYTHRRTRFVHLDVRDRSYHWLDASPPGRTWRGISIGDRSLAARDRSYDEGNDWPEGLPNPHSSGHATADPNVSRDSLAEGEEPAEP